MNTDGNIDSTIFIKTCDLWKWSYHAFL